MIINAQSISVAKRYNLEEETKMSLAKYLNSLQPDAGTECPLCGSSDGAATVIGRFDERTYWRCSRCKIIYMRRLNAPPIEYNKDYFFDSYKKQYGKTYIEDFPNLIAMAKSRLRYIKKYVPVASTAALALLDVGCAYGAFLTAAKDDGFSCLGVESAEDAVDYVNNTLHIDACKGTFPNCVSAKREEFDVLTMWYVIEHFDDCAAAISKASELLKPGGVFAFSTPSAGGVSAIFRKKNFLKNSPADHWTIWNPRHIKKQLRKWFDVKKVVVTGHHPERLPVIGKYLKVLGCNNSTYKLFAAISRIFKLGDTFEVYAIKRYNAIS
jgi:2-polyprenyl-3-methyl-5-hydroxy-6-metoxy-1,4-benzoquinol methylase